MRIYAYDTKTGSELGADIGVPQRISSFSGTEKTKAIIAEGREYVSTLILEKSLKDLCKNQHEDCAFWATLGECEGKKEGLFSVRSIV